MALVSFYLATKIDELLNRELHVCTISALQEGADNLFRSGIRQNQNGAMLCTSFNLPAHISFIPSTTALVRLASPYLLPSPTRKRMILRYVKCSLRDPVTIVTSGRSKSGDIGYIPASFGK